MDACLTSQFEQQARAMAGLPLGGADLLAPAVMLNILGDIWYESADTDAQREPDWAGALSTPTAKLHLYGKREARRGRKMGHVTIVARRWRRRRPMPPRRRGAGHAGAGVGRVHGYPFVLFSHARGNRPRRRPAAGRRAGGFSD